MHILLTNDDSYDSPLFHILYDVLKQQGHSLTCIMPATEQSWKSKSMTRFGKLKLEEQNIDGRSFHTFEGSPAGCVNFGIYKLCSSKPDLVVSGINMGYNVSLSYILSSGTIGAAMEGYLAGFPSLSLSQQLIPDLYKHWNKKRSFPEDACKHLKEQVLKVLDKASSSLPEILANKELWALEMPYQLSENWDILKSLPSKAHYGSAFIENEDGSFSHCSPRLENDKDPKSDINIMHSGHVAFNRLNFRSLCEFQIENN